MRSLVALIVCWFASSIALSNESLFPDPWMAGTTASEHQMQVQPLGPDTFVIRQSVRTNFEAPFLYLLFGKDRALLLDTGAGGLEIRPTIDRLISQWMATHQRTSLPLVVAHSHSHRDHIAGDAEFRDRPGTTVVGLTPREVADYFRIERWPETLGHLDLGGRKLTIIPTPGHQIAHIMIYDPTRALLLSGDALYPGRLYVPVNHMAEERASIDRVVRFARTHRIAAILGAHIEMTREPGQDYPQSAPSHPNEHALELSIEHLRELQEGLRQKLDTPEQPQIHRDFIVYPMPWRAD
jgi:glyoxylase-like metal-dependent hydrolase (beta-lactamase superfamily II)